MATLPESKKSYWIDSTKSSGYPELTEGIEADVVKVMKEMLGDEQRQSLQAGVSES